MIVLACTKKFADFVGMRLTDDVEAKTLNSFGVWYAHMFYLQRRKCLIFTNAETLFSFFVEGVLKKDLMDLPVLFRKELFRAMFFEEFGAEEMEKMKAFASEMIFTKAQNRRVLGSMNDMIFHYSYYQEGYIYSDNRREIERAQKVNRLAMSMIGMKFPVECFQEKLKGFCQS